MHTPDEALQEINEFFTELGKRGLHPKLVKMDLEAFHGTSMECAGQIVASQHFNETTEERGLLGRGVYFYENRPITGVEMASAWAKHDKKYSTQAVVIGHISTEGIFDLTSKENKNYFQAVFDWMVFKVKPVSPDDVWKVEVPKVIKFILRYCPEQSQIQAARWNGFKLRAVGTACQFGLVVRDKKCITNLKIHS